MLRFSGQSIELLPLHIPATAITSSSVSASTTAAVGFALFDTLSDSIATQHSKMARQTSIDPIHQLSAQFADLQPPSSPSDYSNSSKHRRAPGTTHPPRIISWPHSFRTAGRQPRQLSASNHAYRNIWRRGQPIVFSDGSATSGPRRDFSTFTSKRTPSEERELLGSIIPPSTVTKTTVVSKRMAKFSLVENGDATEIEDDGEMAGDSTTGISTARSLRKATQDNTILRIRQISEVANEHFSQLQAELEKLRAERRKRTQAELRQAMDLVIDITERAEMLFKAAGRTSEILIKNLGKQVADDVAEIPDKETASASPDSWVAEDETVDDIGPSPTTTASEDCAVDPSTPKDESPYIPMSSYIIPPKVLEVKKALADDNPNKWWNHTLYVNSEGKGIDVHYCKTIEECEKVLPQFLNEKVVGFDMEWVYPQRNKTSIRQNVAFIQVANESTVALVHVAQMGFDDKGRPLDPSAAREDEATLISPTLRQLIESDQVLKIGVNSTGDHRRLRDFINVKPQGVFELSDLHNLVNSTENGIKKIPRRMVSLAKLTLAHLGLPLDKGPVRTSDWSKPINREQIKYAAADAYAGLRIFDLLEIRRAKLNPRPPRPICRNIEDTSDDYAPKTTSTTSTITTTTETTTVETTIIEGNHGEQTPSASESASNSEVFTAEIEMAGEWVAKYMASFSNGAQPQLSKPQLRAYSLWHVGAIDITEICKIWRDPPLKESTVATYILEAIKVENLPCDTERAKEAFTHIPWLLKDRFKDLDLWKD
ncbi:ribonuclease H-like domain-containing protein [Trichophaea hybrida]|nr:ribonuclease H-like domain-containing protein [Trichophaea hybrida]